MSDFKHIGLVVKPAQAAIKACAEVCDYLEKQGCRCYLDVDSAAHVQNLGLTVLSAAQIHSRCNLLIVIGGDGTFLQAARLLAGSRVKLLGINLGTLGFLTDIRLSEVKNALSQILNQVYTQEQRFLIQAEVYRGKECLKQCAAFNDVTIQKWNSAHMLRFDTSIDGHLLGSQRSDGLLVATPTGSTGYCLSGGGPILHPQLNALVLMYLFPHTLSHAPIIISADSKICITLSAADNKIAKLICDARTCQTLEIGDQVHLHKGAAITVLHPKEHNYYETLRTKLGWGREN